MLELGYINIPTTHRKLDNLDLVIKQLEVFIWLGAESCNAKKVPSDIILTMWLCILLMAQYLVELGSPSIAIT